MANLPEPIAALVTELRKLPGIGPRSAERIALHIVQAPAEKAQQLAATVLQARERIRACSICGALTESSPCAICADPQRDASILCVVEQPTDVLRIEKTGAFRGKYHVLGGKISPINKIGPDQLRIAELEKRLLTEPIREVVLALGTDVESDATGFYLARRLAREGLKVTRIAYGLPAGTGLEFADELTLARALEGRREF
ncbi:MAG: recombination mediator RecR [Verrucomicrobiales bacterium]|nr:recombination mediator RecR [Verrucomicrobiales bacterium]